MNRKAVWLVAGLGALGIAFGAIAAVKFYAAQSAADSTVAATRSPKIGGPFTLVDHKGHKVTDRTFRGKFMLVFFGYTFCPDVCPTELQAIGDALDALGEAGKKVQPIFISVDPERDTVEVMADYVSNFHPRLAGLTGTPEQVKVAAKAYRAMYYKVYPPPFADDSKKEESDGDDENANSLLNPSAVTYLMRPDGSFLRIFGHGTEPEKMADGIRKHLNKENL